MDERLKFVARLLDGEKMAALCREFESPQGAGHRSLQTTSTERSVVHRLQGEFTLGNLQYCCPPTRRTQRKLERPRSLRGRL
jgi:hypothetical protein